MYLINQVVGGFFSISSFVYTGHLFKCTALNLFLSTVSKTTDMLEKLHDFTG